MNPVVRDLLYLAAAVLFILGLKGMTHPRRAVRGNRLGAAGMGLSILVALFACEHYGWVIAGAAVGSGVGLLLATRVQMTAMPQMVALLNGFGGLASVFVAWGALLQDPSAVWTGLLATGLSGLIGAVTFSGSIVAFGKLQELKLFQRPLPIPNPRAVNGVLVIAGLALCGALAAGQADWYAVIVVLSLVLGLTLVSPIGGADMPVVIALLNSYSGLAASATGFVINNSVLIISGSLVGASGIILTQLMCRAMNRPLSNVLFGGGEVARGGPQADEIYATVRSTTPDDVAMILESAQRVVFVPGYGMAVAQAQHAVRDLGRMLEKRGATVEYAIHPVAGRMPGHMNVLLAEADIEYDKLKEMDEINPTMDTVDVAIVIGANDVVNPLARTDPNCPIAGMPILDVDKARTVVVIKRSLSPGFAQIPNPLFAADNALMLFADGKQGVLDIVAALKSL